MTSIILQYDGYSGLTKYIGNHNILDFLLFCFHFIILKKKKEEEEGGVKKGSKPLFAPSSACCRCILSENP